MTRLELDRVCFNSGQLQLIRNLSLCVDKPGISVLMGPNGAGKSLLLRIIHGLLQPTSGKVLWDSKKPDRKLRFRQAMVFQKPVLLRRSVQHNIEFVLRQRKLKADADICARLLARVGLDGMQERPARLLSGGEQQRLALARALALRPEVLLMDEPTASLDPASTLMIEAIMRELVDEQKKIFFVTHDTAQGRRLADDVLFLHRGELIEHSPASTFFEQPASDIARRYLAGQIIV